MKISGIIITMIVAIVASLTLSPVAQAASDQVMASFERDLNREASWVYPDRAVKADEDIVQELVRNAVLRQPDPIRASFDRDLNREPTRVPVRHAATCDVDPLQTLVNVRLQSAKDDTPIMTAHLSGESIGCGTLTQ